MVVFFHLSFYSNSRPFSSFKRWSDREWRESLNKNNSNSLSALRQKLRRYLKQEPLEKEIQAYREVCHSQYSF
jgi:hypothetical protein